MNFSSSISNFFHLDVSFPDENTLIKGKCEYHLIKEHDNHSGEISKGDRDSYMINLQQWLALTNLTTQNAYIKTVGHTTIKNECGSFAPHKDALKHTYSQGKLWTILLTPTPLAAACYAGKLFKEMHEQFILQRISLLGKLMEKITTQNGISSHYHTYKYTLDNLAADRRSSLLCYFILGMICIVAAVALTRTLAQAFLTNYSNSKFHMRQWKVVNVEKKLTPPAQAFSDTLKEKTKEELQGEPTTIPHPTEERFLTTKEKALLTEVIANQWDEESGKFEDPITFETIDNIWTTKILRLGKYIIPLNSALETMLTNTRNDSQIPHPVETRRALDATEQKEFLSHLAELTLLLEKQLRECWTIDEKELHLWALHVIQTTYPDYLPSPLNESNYHKVASGIAEMKNAIKKYYAQHQFQKKIQGSLLAPDPTLIYKPIAKTWNLPILVQPQTNNDRSRFVSQLQQTIFMLNILFQGGDNDSDDDGASNGDDPLFGD